MNRRLRDEEQRLGHIIRSELKTLGTCSQVIVSTMGRCRHFLWRPTKAAPAEADPMTERMRRRRK